MSFIHDSRFFVSTPRCNCS